ncbi:MAG: Xaa-Pro peptidase family protein [Candidatus Omnitrophota bacterium]
MNSRLKKFSKSLSCHDAYLVVNKTDIRYLVGFPVSDSWLLFAGGKPYIITDGRYKDEIRASVGAGILVKEFKTSRVDEVFKIVDHKGLLRLGFDERHVPVSLFKELRKACSKQMKLIALNGLVERSRAIKDNEEISIILKCLEVNRELFAYLQQLLKPGMTERELLYKAENFIKARGAAFSFDPIIASGPNSAYPHAVITNRKIKDNDIVLVDIGIEIDGYKSDLTRIFLSDKIAKLVTDIYKVVAAAQEEAIAHIRANVPVAEIDLAARKSLKVKKLDRFFTHSTGHGVGLDIHECPRLSLKSNEVLQKGMVVTVEPGVYLPQQFGIRIEDMVLVTETGCKVLSRGSKVEPPFHF